MYFTIKRSSIIVGIICVFMSILILFYISTFNENPITLETSTTVNTNWGLSFQEEGRAPIANASADYLKKYDSYYIGNINSKTLYLTFDAGFENGYTDTILDTLKKHNVKATFFLVGNYIETAPELVLRMVNEGHTVGNHTYSHPDMSSISNIDSFKKELDKMEELYKSLTGKDLERFYRPPQGKYSEENLKQAQQLGYKTIFWSLAYVDWYTDNQPTKEDAFKKLIPRVHNGAIILLHSTSKTNSEILDELLTKWKEMGYTFGKLQDLK